MNLIAYILVLRTDTPDFILGAHFCCEFRIHHHGMTVAVCEDVIDENRVYRYFHAFPGHPSCRATIVETARVEDKGKLIQKCRI